MFAWRVRREAALRALAHCDPRAITTIAAALAMMLTLATGVLDPVERRLSDAWFAFTHTTPSARTVLVTVDNAAARRRNGPHFTRRDLAQVLLALDRAGAPRILVELGLAGDGAEAGDQMLERAMAQLGRKAAVSANAVRTGNQSSWRRNGPNDRFARHVVRTASDLAPDEDGMLRWSGIENANLPDLIDAPAWVGGARRGRATMVDRDTSTEGARFRIDFGIDLSRIPVLDAWSVLRGQTTGVDLSGATVIIGPTVAPPGQVLRVPRYGELTRAQVTALAAETLALARPLRALRAGPANLGLAVLAALLALIFMCLDAVAGAIVCVGVALAAAVLGAALQIGSGALAPAAGATAAALLGYASAQVARNPSLQRLRDTVNAMLVGTDIRLARALDDTADGLLTFNAAGSLVSINSAARVLLGLDLRREPREVALSTLIGPQADAILAVLRDRAPRRLQTIVRHDGATRHLELAVNAVAGEQGWTGVATVRDISEQRAQFEALNRIATQDALTGIGNRRAFEAALQSACAGGDGPFALMVCDLDGFKPINDTLGHEAGDVLLREIAGRLAAESKPDGVAYRLGGDEFAVLLVRATPALADAIARRLVREVRRSIRIGGKDVEVGVSIGITLGAPPADRGSMLERADAAMYTAKRSRCGYAFADERAHSEGGLPSAA